METKTVLQQYRNEMETERNTDKALIETKYIGRSPFLKTPEQIEKGVAVPVECYFSNNDDVWYARTPAKNGTPAGEWVRANIGNLPGLVEE